MGAQQGGRGQSEDRRQGIDDTRLSAKISDAGKGGHAADRDWAGPRGLGGGGRLHGTLLEPGVVDVAPSA